MIKRAWVAILLRSPTARAIATDPPLFPGLGISGDGRALSGLFQLGARLPPGRGPGADALVPTA
jgi:hypothetical protein